MVAAAETQAATLERFIEAWKKWDPQEWLAVFSDDFTQVTMPFGMGIPVRSRAEVEQVLPILMDTVKNYELTVHDVVHDAARNKAAVYTISKGDTPFGPWALEYAAFLTFNEAGNRVARVEEMLDSAFMQEFGPKFRKYLQEKGYGH